MTQIVPVAVVTGASRGIGNAIVKKLASHGISCLAIASSPESIRSIALETLHKQQRHRALAIDLSNWPEWTQKETHYGIELQPNTSGNFSLFEMLRSWSTPDKRYCLDLLVNCAGVTQTTLSVSTPPATISRIMNVNFMSCVSLCNMAIRQMIRDRKYTTSTPQIINIGSVLGSSSLRIPGTSIYASSKAALNQYSQVLAQETDRLGINVQTINPGLVRTTNMVQDLDKRSQQQLEQLKGVENQTVDQIADIVWASYTNSMWTRDIFSSHRSLRTLAGKFFCQFL